MSLLVKFIREGIIMPNFPNCVFFVLFCFEFTLTSLMLTISVLWPSTLMCLIISCCAHEKQILGSIPTESEDPSGSQKSVLKNPLLMISDAGGPEITLQELLIHFRG